MQNNRIKNWKFNFGLFVLFFLCSLVLFFKGWNSGWMYDSIRYSYFVKLKSLRELLGLHIDHTLQYAYYTIYYLLVKLCGSQGWDWFLVHISLHSLNAWLVFKICRYLQFFYSDKQSDKLSLLAALLFLASSTTTEVVTYHAAIHFLYTTTLLLMALLMMFRYVLQSSKTEWIVFFFCFTLALFSLEITYTFPLICGYLLFAMPERFAEKKRSYYIKFALIPLMLVLFYLLLNKIILGDFVGHYGKEKHLRFTIERASQFISKTLLDFYAFIEYWKMDKMLLVYKYLYMPKVYYTLAIIYIVLYFVIARVSVVKSVHIPFIVLNVILLMASTTFSLSILYIIPVEEDRYSYYYSFLIYFWLLWLFYRYSPRAAYLVFIILIVTQIFCLQINLSNWQVAQKTIDYSIPSFPYHKDKRYMLLASPVYANGVLIWDTHESDVDPFDDKYQILAKALYVKRNIDVRGRIAPVLQYNVLNEHEVPVISTVNDSTIRMTLPCCGKWWWKHGVGAGDFETNYYKVRMIGGWQQEVEVTFKQKPSDMVYVYQCGTNFCEYRF